MGFIFFLKKNEAFSFLFAVNEPSCQLRVSPQSCCKMLFYSHSHQPHLHLDVQAPGLETLFSAVITVSQSVFDSFRCDAIASPSLFVMLLFSDVLPFEEGFFVGDNDHH